MVTTANKFNFVNLLPNLKKLTVPVHKYLKTGLYKGS